MAAFGRAEKIIFIGAILALMVFSYFLYDDSLLFPPQSHGQLELIGSVSLSQNDVRRKNLDTFSWQPAGQKDQIFQNDSVFTGDRSEASILLKDGSLIQVRPNSLISLNMKNGQMNLDLRYGNLVGELAEGSSLTVKSGQEEFKLENDPTHKSKSTIEFKKGPSGNVNLKLVSGHVALNKKELTSGAALRLSKEGQITPVVRPVVTLVQDSASYFRVQPQDPLPFKWQSSGNVSRYKLEISPSEDFNTDVVSEFTPEQNLDWTAPLDPGTYYWRIKAYDLNGQVALTTDPASFTLSQIAPPQILTPTAQAQLDLDVPQPAKGPLLSATEVKWTAIPQLESFNWQLATDSEFTTILKEESTTQKQLQTPPLESGNYWVRVRGATATNDLSEWSEAVPFSLNLVVKKGTERLPPPVLISKKIDFTPPSSREPAAVQEPVLQWKPVTRTATYVLEIAADRQFKNSSQREVKSATTTWTPSRPGQFFFRVYSKNPVGLLSTASEVGEIQVHAINPQLKPFATVIRVGESPALQIPAQWTQVPFAKSYLVQMASSTDFTSPQQFTFTENNADIPVPAPGKYLVRVQGLDESLNPVTGFSNIEELLYTSRNLLNSPQLAEPFNKASIFLQKEMEPFIWLEWKKVDNATSYQIEVSDRPDFSRVLIRKALTENRYLIKERVPLGKIYWRVRAESKDTHEVSKWTELREFTLYHQKNEIFVQ